MAGIRSLAGLIIAAVVLLPTVLAAQERVPQTVYMGQVHDGKGYAARFYPENEQTIYVLADVPNILVPRQTQVYWWPITREYKADWDSANQPVSGTLEVDGRAFPMVPFSLRYNGGYESAKTSIITGEDATGAYATYQQALADYTTATRAYNEQREAFEQEVERWGELVAERRAQGESTNDIPVPREPQAPSPVTVTVTEPQQGFAITLPEGTHTVRVRDADGQVVSGSERTVVAFTHRREGLAYNVIAASKWTRPEVSVEPGDTIYVGDEQALYLQPTVQREYDAFHYAKLLNPQETATQNRRGRWTWVSVAPYEGASLSLSRRGQEAESVSLRSFYVRQRPGGSLGYDILPYDSTVADPSSTFEAFEVRPRADTMTVEVPGATSSRRDVRVIRRNTSIPLLSLAMLPLSGLVWVAVPRRRTR